MSEDQFEREILSHAGIDRRSFIKKMVAGAAFGVPVVVSFDMLTNSVAGGVTCSAPNSTTGGSGQGTTGGAGGSRTNAPSPGACGGDPDGGTGGTRQPRTKSDGALKTSIVPVVWG